MKKTFNLLNKILTVVVVFSLALELTLFVNTNKIQPLAGSVAPAPVNDKQTVTAFEKFGIDMPVAVDLLVNKSSLARLSQREQLEQVRDWLLFTIASSSGLSRDAINRITFDLPPIRYGFLEATSHFQFGELRSLYMGNGQVIALIPADLQGDLRTDRLAQIADDQRKATGNIPVSLFVFEYTIAPDLGNATLTQRTSMTGKDLFTEAAGYYEMKVASLDDLTTFMALINDVTFVGRDPGGVIIGGRKLKSSIYQNIAVEDVAALWQANETIKDQWNAFDAKWQPRIESYNLRCASGLPSFDFYLTTPVVPPLQGGAWSVLGLTCAEEKEAIEAGQLVDYQENQLVNGTGFSLDPTYDYAGLREFFQPYRESLMTLSLIGAATAEDVTAAYDGLDNSDILPMLQMLDTLAQNDDAEVVELADSMDALIHYTYSFNQARYDGNLQGTNVGMTLFYTDLLAKLWALDFNDSAPTDVISEFRPIPEGEVSLVYENEIRRLNNTRLWFGPAKDGFQLTGVEKDLFLGRKSTRVYAASSNPLQPGKEETANESSFAFLNWWDTHYDEIAAYEPQYQRLNEIMKWSLIISWLNGTSEQNELSYLGGVSVTNTYWFPDWVKEHPELRFDHWDDVEIYPRGSFGTQTEVVPVLSSASYNQFGEQWVLSGGVSLADLDTFTGIKPLIPGVENDLFLRAGLDIDSITANSLKTLEKTQIQFLDDVALESRLIATPEESALLRNIDSDVLNVPLERTIQIQSIESGTAITNSVKSETFLVNAKLGANELGTLNIQTKASGFEVGWISRDVDMGQTLAINMSKDANPLVPLLKDSNVTTVIELSGENNFLVHLKNSKKWMETGIVKPNTADVEWASHVSDPIDGMQIIGTKWVDAPGSVLNPATVGPELRFSASPNGVLSISAKEAPAATRVVEIKIGDSTIMAKVDPATGEVFVPVKSIPDEVLNAPERLENLITTRDLVKLQQQMNIASDQPLSVISKESQWLEMRGLDSQYSSGNFGDIARKFAGSPEDSSRLIAEHLGQNLEAADELIANGQWAQADAILDDLTGFYGGHPEINLRRSIVQIEQGRIAQASETLNLTQPMKVSDMTSFYDEVNGLLQSVKEQQNVIRATQTQEWELLQSKGMLPADGKVLSFSNGNRLELEYYLSGRLDGAPIDVSQGIDLGRPVYVQDSPGLNNLDWGTSVDQSIHTVINGDLGTVIRLPRGDIAHFVPDRIFNGDQILFRNVTTGQFNLPASLFYQPYECYTDESQANACITSDWIYVVIAK